MRPHTLLPPVDPSAQENAQLDTLRALTPCPGHTAQRTDLRGCVARCAGHRNNPDWSLKAQRLSLAIAPLLHTPAVLLCSSPDTLLERAGLVNHQDDDLRS